MKLFPIGTANAASSVGTLDGTDYVFFEPNAGCNSLRRYNTLVTTFENQIMQTRKKSEPHITLQYKYNNILEREYDQLEHFVDSIEDALTPFYVVDLSKGETVSNVASVAGNWQVEITKTRFYSDVVNQKASRVFLYAGSAHNFKWRTGDVQAITTNASIAVSVTASHFGSMTLSQAQSECRAYPMYKAYVAQNSLGNFKTTNYIDETIDTSSDGGWMRTGDINFVSKYKV